MKINLTVIALLLLLSISSCKKNDDINDSNNNNSPVRLKRYATLDGQDTLLNCSFNYDSQNRIVESHKLFYETGIRSYDIVANFLYNGNDTLPSRINYTDVDFTGGYPNYNYSEHFFYNVAGLLVKDSIAEPTSNPLVYNFAYFPDYFRVITNFGDTVFSHQNLSNGNISNEADTVSGSTISPFTVGVQNSFDNHVNPLQYAEVRRVLLYMPENFIQDYELPAFNNNLLTTNIVKDGSNPSQTNSSFSYTYNAAGYPVTSQIHDVISGDNFQSFYYYD